MLGAYQLDRARKNLSGYALLAGMRGPDCGCGCGGICGSHGHALSGLNGNPTLTADAAFQQAMTAYGNFHLNTKSSINAAWISEAESQIESGQFDVSWYSSTCTAAQAAPSLNLFTTGSGLALGVAGPTVGFLASPALSLIPAAAVPIIGWVIAGIGAIIGLIDAIFAHHAAAVKRDLNFGCGALPAVNNAMSVLSEAVASGQTTPANAAAGVAEIYSQFMQAGGASGSASGPGSIPSSGVAINDSPYCNSNCEMSLVLLGMVLYWQSQYLAMATPAPVASSAPVAVAAAAAASSTPAVFSPITVTPTSSLSPAAPTTPASAVAATAAPAAPLSTWWILAGAALVGLALSEVL